MKQNYGLTSTKMELMELFWDTKQPYTFRELLQYSNEVLGKNWKKQTLSTYLTNLQKMGLLDVSAKGKNNVYQASGTKDEYIHQWTEKLVRTAFDSSISKLVAAFTGGKKLSKEEAEEIKRLME